VQAVTRSSLQAEVKNHALSFADTTTVVKSDMRCNFALRNVTQLVATYDTGEKW